jgi:hypothetical protein
VLTHPNLPAVLPENILLLERLVLKFWVLSPPFIYWRNFAKIQNWTIERLNNWKWSDFWGFQSPEVREKQSPEFLIWISICRYRRMIQDFYLVSGLQPDLDKSSKGWSPLWLYQKIPNKKAHVYPAGVKYNFLFQPVLAGSLILNRFRFKV